MIFFNRLDKLRAGRRAWVCWLLSACLLVPLSTAAAGRDDLNLRTLDGKPLNLAQRTGHGRWLLVMFWALECAVCEANRPDIDTFYRRHRGRDAEVLGVNIDGWARRDEVAARLRRQPTSYPNVLVDLGELAERFTDLAGEPFRGTPTFLLYAPDGKLKAVNPGRVRLKALEAYLARYADQYKEMLR